MSSASCPGPAIASTSDFAHLAIAPGQVYDDNVVLTSPNGIVALDFDDFRLGVDGDDRLSLYAGQGPGASVLGTFTRTDLQSQRKASTLGWCPCATPCLHSRLNTSALSHAHSHARTFMRTSADTATRTPRRAQIPGTHRPPPPP